MKANVKPIPSFKDNPYAFGMPRVSRTGNESARLRRLFPVSEKSVMGGEYNQNLIKKLGIIDSLEVQPNIVEASDFPEIRYVNPRKDLYVDHNWQRELKGTSLVLLTEIIQNFDWSAFKVPNVYEWPDKRLFATDGQTTIIACAHHPEIKTIPVLVLKAPLEDLMRRQAKSFVTINQNRRIVSSSDILPALICGGDSRAMAMANILREFNIQLKPVQYIDKTGQAPGESFCVNIFRHMHNKYGDDDFRIICKILHHAARAPIRREHLWALNSIFQSKISPEKINFQRMGNAIRSITDKHAMLEAKSIIANPHTKLRKQSDALAQIYWARYEGNTLPLN